MTSDGFLERLGRGKVVNCVYKSDDVEGLISAWAIEGRFILTWEECPSGNQYDESTFTRDERHEFKSAEAVLEFVERNGYPAASFSP